MAIITTIDHLHVLGVYMLVHHLLPTVTVPTLATRPTSAESVQFNFPPYLLIHCMLLFRSFHHNCAETTGVASEHVGLRKVLGIHCNCRISTCVGRQRASS